MREHFTHPIHREVFKLMRWAWYQFDVHAAAGQVAAKRGSGSSWGSGKKFWSRLARWEDLAVDLIVNLVADLIVDLAVDLAFGFTTVRK